METSPLKHMILCILFNFYLKEMREKGALKQIFNKYDRGGQVCPDMSGQPLGFESCFTAFVALIGGVAAGLVLLFIECFSKWTKFNVPWLDIYDTRASASTDLEEADEMALS